MPWRPRLRTVLLLVNVLILLLPVGGIAILRLYENELIRRTESELIVQGAVVREFYTEAYVEESRRVENAGEAQGTPVPPVTPTATDIEDIDLTPLRPMLDISEDEVRPPAPAATASADGPLPVAAAAGQRVAEQIDAAARTTLAGIRIVDARGVVVATTGAELGLSLADRESVARALAGENVSLLRRRISDEPRPALQSVSRGQRYRVFVALPVVVDDHIVGAVVLSRTPMDITKALYLNRRPLLIGASGLLVVVILVSVLTSLTISRPVRALTRQAELVSRGEQGDVVPLESPGTHEVAQLSDALTRMARTLEDRADYIREFASHVSHEFKTPLTTMRGAIELLRDTKTMTPAEQQRFVQILSEASERLEHLVRRLLDLARADVLRPGDERTRVADAVERAARRHREAGTHVEVEHDAAIGSVRMAEELLDEIVSNILDNARQHGGDGVHVVVGTRLDMLALPPEVEIRIEDDGPGISKANAARVFTPFFTTARERGGSGLGLSIARAQVEAHGGSIELAPSSRGAVFVIRLPADVDPPAGA